jgi:hypothetical protein
MNSRFERANSHKFGAMNANNILNLIQQNNNEESKEDVVLVENIYPEKPTAYVSYEDIIKEKSTKDNKPKIISSSIERFIKKPSIQKF